MVDQGSSIILKRHQTGGTCGFQQTNNSISSTRGHPSRKTWRSQTKCQSGESFESLSFHMGEPEPFEIRTLHFWNKEKDIISWFGFLLWQLIFVDIRNQLLLGPFGSAVLMKIIFFPGSSRWDCSWWGHQGRPCSHGQGQGSCQQRGPTGIYATQHRRLKHGRKNSANLSSQDDYPGGILEAKSTKPG